MKAKYRLFSFIIALFAGVPIILLISGLIGFNTTDVVALLPFALLCIYSLLSLVLEWFDFRK